MKKLWILLILCVLLCGCAAAPTFETVDDVYTPSAGPQALEMELDLPKNAAMLTSNGENLYFCSGYELMTQTLPSGDLEKTLKSITGYDRDHLTLLETSRDGMPCYTCAWTSLGESGNRVGRAVILDDGHYHYCLSVMADAEVAGQVQAQWQEVLASVQLKEKSD